MYNFCANFSFDRYGTLGSSAIFFTIALGYNEVIGFLIVKPSCMPNWILFLSKLIHLFRLLRIEFTEKIFYPN